MAITPKTLTIEDGNSSPQCPYDPNLPPLDERILTLVRTSKNLTIRPSRLTSELGLCIKDASAELCGLLSAVGSAATFRFVTATNDGGTNGIMTMVFTFPHDFERRARNYRRNTDAKAAVGNLLALSLQLTKVVVAFGLIVSLAVVVVFGLCAAVALVVALSRSGGNDLGRRRTGSMVRTLVRTLREMLWIFVVFGPAEGDGLGGRSSGIRGGGGWGLRI